ncbi:LPXTG cell wall anchor domain-containing protein, partial [Bacillus thuringiensis]|nr:LPXTG cell wall anchor domain-containing protein [Bacillus thuringiensis]
EDKVNKEDNGTVTEDKGTNEDKGNKEDKGTVTEDKGTQTDGGSVTGNKDNKIEDKVTAEKENKETVTSTNNEGNEKVAEKQVDKKETVKDEINKPTDKKVEKDTKATSKETAKETKAEAKDKKLPETGGDQSTTMGSLIAGGLAILASVVMRRKSKKQN